MKRKRSLIRTAWLMWVRYLRWRNNPKNTLIVTYMDMHNKINII